MTPQERSMLSDLIGRVEATKIPDKDNEAQDLLQQRLGNNPDALYVLAQTVLVQKYALEQSKTQLDQLRAQAQSAQQPQHKSGGFLDSIFGHKEEPAQRSVPPSAPPARAAYPPPQSVYPQQQAGYPQQQAGYPPPQQGYAPPPTGGGSSFLRSAATTAAGVAAGALAFQGVESLMHGFGHAAGFGGGFGGGGGFMGGGGMPMEETVVNNYYDSPGNADQFGNAGLETGGRDAGLNDSSFLPQGSDADLTPQLDQASDVNVTGDDTSPVDLASDANLDNAVYDDNTPFDDSGDMGGGDIGGDDDSSFA